MKKTAFIITVMLAVLLTFDSCGVKKELSRPQAVMAEIGKPGTAVVKVWSFSKSARIKDDFVFENAISCLLFDGIETDEFRRIKGRPALVSGGYQSNQEYFDTFFSNKEYLSFCSMGIGGYVEQGDLLKVEGGYKIGKIVIVQYDQLRNKLVSDGIIRGLDSGF